MAKDDNMVSGLAHTLIYLRMALLPVAPYLLFRSQPSSICTTAALVKLIIHIKRQTHTFQHIVSAFIEHIALYILQKGLLATAPTLF